MYLGYCTDPQKLSINSIPLCSRSLLDLIRVVEAKKAQNVQIVQFIYLNMYSSIVVISEKYSVKNGKSFYDENGIAVILVRPPQGGEIRDDNNLHCPPTKPTTTISAIYLVSVF